MTEQIFWLFGLALPVACVAWTVTKEEVFRELRDWLEARSRDCRRIWQRKFCYMWTCEYCFSHYVAAAFIALTGFKFLLDDWRGYLLALLALVAVANAYMSAYSRLRVEIHKEKAETKKTETITRKAG